MVTSTSFMRDTRSLRASWHAGVLPEGEDEDAQKPAKETDGAHDAEDEQDQDMSDEQYVLFDSLTIPSLISK